MAVVKPENYFWLNNGEIMRDMHELSHAMKVIDDSVFAHHVTPERNDFYNWTKDVLNDPVLAKKLLSCKNREEMSSVIDKRISQLSKIKNKRESKKQIISQLMEVHNA